MRSVVLLLVSAALGRAELSTDELLDQARKVADDTGVRWSTCRILSQAYTNEEERANEGYAWQNDQHEVNYHLDQEKTRKFHAAAAGEGEVGCSRLPALAAADVTREKLLAAKRPLIIRNVTNAWAAHEEWTLDALQTTSSDSIFLAGLEGQASIGQVLAQSGKYHTGQVGMPRDCYTDGGSMYAKISTLTPHERHYSPFLATSRDYTLPGFLQPSRQLYMALAVGNSTGVEDESHPSGWFAAIHGRKRWLLHPPAANDPGNLFQISGQPRSCGSVTALFTSSIVCDQQEGDVLWLPHGWWHETCNLDSFSAGLGGVTYKELENPRVDLGKCNLGPAALKEAQDRVMGHQHSVDEIPYCLAHGAAACPTLPARYVPHGAQGGLTALRASLLNRWDGLKAIVGW